jgi:hypothetical protein
MVHGVIVAAMVSFVWILLQNWLMHVRPAENRFQSILSGYLVSLPTVFLAYRWIPPFSARIAESMITESPLMGIFHAYFFHLLVFFCYAECFYHVERSVTLRLLVELLQHGDEGVHLSAIQARYSVGDMIRQRLDVLQDRGFLDRQGDAWRLRPKGLLLARATAVLSWLFQAPMQHERS